jgi:capsular polysaccharide export protein
MRIICVGTLDKFSRFFLKLRKELNLEINAKVYVYSLHLSGFLYTFIRLKFSCWITVKSWFKVILNKKKYLQIIKKSSVYKSVHFKKLITYHSNLDTSISKQNLLLQAIAYIDIIELLILKKTPDLIILIGDSKLSIEVFKVLAKKHLIQTYFLEQGPFNTTIFDNKGVNANASIREFKLTNNKISGLFQEKNIFNFIKRPKTIKYRRSPIYRGLDFVLSILLRKSYLYPPDLKFTDTFPKLALTKKLKLDILKNDDKNIKTFLLILQIPMDVNMIYHSPFFKNHISIVKKIHQNLPENSRLVLREHPLYVGKYEKELYDYSKNFSVLIDNNTSLKDSLNLADVIIVNNSTVGIEAIAIQKTVVVLGNCYYDNPKICIKYHQNDNLKLLLNKALNFNPNKDSINAFLNEFIFNYLVEGFITDKNLIAAKTISTKLKARLN